MLADETAPCVNRFDRDGRGSGERGAAKRLVVPQCTAYVSALPIEFALRAGIDLPVRRVTSS
jgi:hypothetical protein